MKLIYTYTGQLVNILDKVTLGTRKPLVERRVWVVDYIYPAEQNMIQLRDPSQLNDKGEPVIIYRSPISIGAAWVNAEI